MIITLTRSILYLLLLNSVVIAQKIDVSFEVFHATKDYMDIAQQKLKLLQAKGFNCYIAEKKDTISLLCNDSHTLQEMQNNINKLQKEAIVFTIIAKKNKDKKRYKTVNELQEGYKAYNKKEYTKAYTIFLKLYKKDKSFEVVYAYALVLMKLHKYEQALSVLQNCKQKKARLLYNDIANAYFHEVLEVKRYDVAYKLIKKYHLKKQKKLEIPYKKALDLFKKKEYNNALDTLSSYKHHSNKIQKLYNEILYTKYITDAWSYIEKDPLKAVKIFKEGCKIKKEFDCYKGMMYAYYKLGKYDVSLYLAEKLYNYKADPKLAEMALNSNLALKNYQEAQKWYEHLADSKGFKDAKKEFLKAKMNQYMMQKNYIAAKKIAKNILQDNPNDSDANYILALDAFKRDKYKLCLSIIDDVNLTQDYQKNLLYRCKAYSALEDGEITQAQKSIENVTNDTILYSFYIDLAKYFDKKGDIRALKLYKKAKELDKKNIGSELLYLYALNKFHQDTLLQKELASAYVNFPKEQKSLDEFKSIYDKKKLLTLYQAKNYEKCYAFSKTIKKEQKDKDIYTLSAWCAYSIGNYTAAKEAFLEATKLKKNSNEELYAYALSCLKLNERDNALKALNKIKISTKQEKLQVADLYADLQEQQKAYSLIKSIPNTMDKEKIIQSINKSYTKLFYENAISAGLYWQSQNGTSGLTAFDKYVIPVDYDYFDLVNNMHFYIDADIMYLYNGKLDSVETYKKYGFATATQENTLEKETAFMPKIGIDYKQYHIMLGTTPLGSRISPELTALLSTYFVKNQWLASFKIEQKELDETMLSFVGERAKDGRQEVYWGRVLKRGATVGINYDAAVSLALNFTYFPEIFGKNVQTNKQKKAVVTAIYYPAVESLEYMQLGAIGIYDSYDKNENLFTYGHGGYFSPQSFFMAGVFTEFGDHVSKDFYYKAKVGLGFETYSVDDAKKFPLHDGVVHSTEVVKGYDENGFDYKLALQLGYKLNKNFDLISGLSFEKFQNYTIHEISFALVYRFANHYNDFNTFYLNHRVDHIIPRYEVAK